MLCPSFFIFNFSQLCSFCEGFVILVTVQVYFWWILEENEAACLQENQAASFSAETCQKYACAVTEITYLPDKVVSWPRWLLKDNVLYFIEFNQNIFFGIILALD